MKRLLQLSILLFAFISCDTTDPKPPEDKPSGYQEDIPWPSLADAPKSIINYNPQNNGRSDEVVSITGEIAWAKTDFLNLEGGISVDSEGIIYIADQGHFYALTQDGNEKWKIKIEATTNSTALLTRNNEVIIFYPFYIFSYSLDGELKWEIPISINFAGQFNIGKNGEIFIIGESTLLSIKDGQLIWSLSDPSIRWGSSISPDGKYLYAVGTDNSLVQIDLDNRSIVRKLGKHAGRSRPLIDSYGNIYFSSVIDGFNNNEPALFKANENLEVQWFFSHNQYRRPTASSLKFKSPQIVIDKLGNIVFGSDTLYSLSYEGEMNWKYVPDAPIGTPPIIDDQQNIYLVKNYGGNRFGLLILTSNGIPLLDTPGEYEGASSNFSGALVNNSWFLPTQDKRLYKIN